MEFFSQRNTLSTELQLIQGIVERKNSVPILSTACLEVSGQELKIAATDLDISLRIQSEADVRTSGSLTANAKRLFEIIRSLPESQVRIVALPDNWLLIESEDVKFKIAGMSREDFPSLPEDDLRDAIGVDGRILGKLIAKTVFAVTVEDTRYFLAGALLAIDKQGMAVVATDGHRLSYARAQCALDVKGEHRILIPRKAIQELGRFLTEGPTQIKQTQHHLIFKNGQRILTSKLVDGQFPSFDKVVTFAGDKVVAVAKERLAMAIRRVGLLSPERSRAVRLSLTKGQLMIASSSPDIGEASEQIAIDFDGDDVEINFNGQYILDFLSVVSGDQIVIELKDSQSQGLIRPKTPTEDIDQRYIIMPMRF